MITLHYWKIRGLLSPLIHLCEYLEIPYKVEYVEKKEDWV